MEEAVVVSPNDKRFERLQFKPYRSTVERRVIPFLPAPGEPQSMEVKTPWGGNLTAKYGDFLISELSAPNDYWPIDPVIFEETYIITRPGYCVKRGLINLVPLIELTNGSQDRMVTVETMEGPVTVRAGDFYLAKGVKGEIWPYPKEKVENALVPAD
jgi:hypothetical protein